MSTILTCPVCPHACSLKEGAVGRCRARKHVNDGNEDKIVPINYAIATSLALDPIEKKPLNRFYPGSYILSVGSFGCNLSCPFCQNHEISTSDGTPFLSEDNRIAPDELVDIALNTRSKGNIGIAFTYNEPLVGYEYVLDCARMAKEAGLKTVLVTAGCINKPIAEQVLPYIDALNIDLKAFKKETYSKTLGGNLDTVRTFIEEAVKTSHVELTTLVVPGMNDTAEEMNEICDYILTLKGGVDIPLHISRFFPRHKMTDRQPTGVGLILKLADLAGKKLNYVYPGNI
ncbi:MAG: AmmeMemoRadiSam system radical SAM enzyme [Lachnospiraceae bacterium]|nr:AmmeMemoRadiSam system radical SAM enzyme [Lachnospiraceae bacterium]